MKIIKHRINTIAQLTETPTQYGLEIDIRSYNGKLILHHDPMIQGDSLDEWLRVYDHGLLILNVKEEGLESELIAAMAANNIDQYFFLDQSFPFLVKWAKGAGRRSAVRISEFESIDTALTLAGQIDWVWVDYFTRFPLGPEEERKLRDAGFQICLVSPELQGHEATEHIPSLISLLEVNNIVPDAVCTKMPELWERAFGK